MVKNIISMRLNIVKSLLWLTLGFITPFTAFLKIALSVDVLGGACLSLAFVSIMIFIARS